MQVKRRKGEDASEAEDEERALSVIATLFQNLARGSRRDRLAAKFVENEFEKCDRLMELYMRYHSRVAAAEVQPETRPELIASLLADVMTVVQVAAVQSELSLWLL